MHIFDKNFIKGCHCGNDFKFGVNDRFFNGVKEILTSKVM